jgi:capsular exopolysaccharide synthesis family protein
MAWISITVRKDGGPMSRLEAALRRASTGVVDEQAPAGGGDDERLQDWALADHELSTRRSAPAFDDDAIRSAGADDEQDELEPTEPDAVLRVDESSEPRFLKFNSRYSDKLVVSSEIPAALREHYRRLGATLHHAQAESGLKTLMVSSALPEEGKTLTATNIALTLSESYQRSVLLIDADLRRPSLADVFQLPKVFGLSEALTSVPERSVSLIQVSPHLALLPAGAPDHDPMSKLTSDRMRRLLAESAAAFDWVIIDTPPVGILTDAKLLGAMVDSALFVVRAGRTPAKLVQRAVDALGRDRIMGVVLNRAEIRQNGRNNSYYTSYYYSAPRRQDKA